MQDSIVVFPSFTPLSSYPFSERCQHSWIMMLINSPSLRYPFGHYHTFYVEKYVQRGHKSSTSSRASWNRLCHSITRGRDTTSSPSHTSINKRKLPVADFPSFTRNCKLTYAVQFLSSGMVSTRIRLFWPALAGKLTERGPTKLLLFGATPFIVYKRTNCVFLHLYPVYG